MNYMEQTAHMLGVKIGEEFMIDAINDNNKYKLTEKGLMVVYPDGYFSTASYVLMCLLNGVYKIHKYILDDVERKYLTGIIGPFKDRVESIYKYHGNLNSVESIIICIRNDNSIVLPSFKAGAMYQNMEPWRKYSLEELDL